ncbi:iron permease FTR1 [Stanieria cyanosphaera PCC 7437]|uniref:Iron permease FTR1 n=1 Tax=Stanieria cyanosphaera (strain ATCC 29371 / PCC 7437) TaxID=111780 RepID=K9XQX7_STAC7|nr:FTR1 family protein [Stanieria cyanosphaera]AFZ35020.1 iron permease FTR1 [Stanieria cyanosphaera PCC 7437]
MIDLTTALPTFVVTLREGFEAALVVGIVMACLQKAQQPQLYRWVYLGIGGGITASVAVGFFLAKTIQQMESVGGIYAPVIKESLAGIFGLVAIAMLSWMLLWMTQQAKSLKGEVEGVINQALNHQSAGKAIFLLIFIAVLREGFETVLFIVAKFQQQWTLPALGAIAGLTVATIMGILLFALGVKINIRLFFQIMGVFLLLIVGGLVLGVLKHLDATVALLSQLSTHNWCFADHESCILGAKIWDGTEFLPDQKFPGIILKSLFGYRQTLYLGQVIAYILFLVTVGGAYWQSLTNKPIFNSKKTTKLQN